MHNYAANAMWLPRKWMTGWSLLWPLGSARLTVSYWIRTGCPTRLGTAWLDWRIYYLNTAHSLCRNDDSGQFQMCFSGLNAAGSLEWKERFVCLARAEQGCLCKQRADGKITRQTPAAAHCSLFTHLMAYYEGIHANSSDGLSVSTETTRNSQFLRCMSQIHRYWDIVLL